MMHVFLASLVASIVTHALGGMELYTNNMVCRKNFCIDPIFPALPAIEQLEAKEYECQEEPTQSRSMLHFCYEPVTYGYNLPIPPPGGDPTPKVDLVKMQEQEAVTYYAYHLSAMGYEYWENAEPWQSEDPCVRATWRLTCFTFFPKCNDLADGKYLRPCRSSCDNYRKVCNVECCDESVSCIFEHTTKLSDGSQKKSSAYVDHVGPSELCTGSAMRQTGVAAFILASLAYLSL